MFTDHDNFFVMQSIHAIFVVGSGTNLKRISKYQPFADTIHRDHTRIQRRVHAGAEFALLHAHTAPSKKNKVEQQLETRFTERRHRLCVRSDTAENIKRRQQQDIFKTTTL